MAGEAINVKTTVRGKKLTITIDLEQDHGPSKSGKTHIIATSKGNVRLGEPHSDIMFGLNVFRKV